MAKYTRTNVETGHFIGWDSVEPDSQATEASLEYQLGKYLPEEDAEIFAGLSSGEEILRNGVVRYSCK